MKRALALLALSALAACATVYEQPTERLAQATLRLADGTPAGTALILSSGTGVNISVVALAILPGVHGVHLHATGACDGPDFASAGAHLDPENHEHGRDNPAGAHFGDLPNLTTEESGAGTVSAALGGTRAEVLAWLFDGDGTAVVVHAMPDDYRTDPSGNSGARIACGVLRPL